MYRMLSVQAFDMLDAVHVHARLKNVEELSPGAESTVLERTTSIQSVGRSDDHEWLRDVLVALLEDL